MGRIKAHVPPQALQRARRQQRQPRGVRGKAILLLLLSVLVGGAILLVNCNTSHPAVTPDRGIRTNNIPPPRQEVLVAEFNLREYFHVNHPDQIVDFELKATVDPGTAFMLGSDGEEVPYQILEKGRRIAVRTDLQADEIKTWKLMRGHAPAAVTDGVVVRTTPQYYEITNGLVGIRVPVTPPDGKASAKAPAPVQGLRLPDGTWTATGPNYLGISGDVRSMRTELMENGPLKVLVDVTYELDRAQLNYGQQVIAKAGPGKYVSRIEIQAGQPSILFEEDTDTQFGYGLTLSGVKLTQARYRGHHSSRKEYGYEADGRQYRASHERAGGDAFFDLPFDRDHGSGYQTNLDQWPAIRRMLVWDPWAFDSGWYWQLYDQGGAADSPLIGIFAGHAGRARDAGISGTGIFTTKTGNVGLAVSTGHRGPDARLYAQMRYQWGLFLGTKGKDLLDPGKVQPINLQMNLHGGISLNKVKELSFDFPDPPPGYGAMYMDKAAVQKMIARLRTDKADHDYAYNTVPYTRPLIDMWCDTTGAKLKSMVAEIDREAQQILNDFVNAGGIYETRVHYWHGGLAMSRKLLWIDQILASDQATPEERETVKRAAVLYGTLLFDEDFVPLSGAARVNLGTENMPVQQLNYRNMYALFLARHPNFEDRARAVWEQARRMVQHTINEHGAHMGCSHYIGAANGPLLSTLQQLQMADVADPFKEEPRLAKYAEFEMNFMTPPDPRYGNVRKRPAIGDSCPNEATEFLGQLATAYRNLDPELSARLLGAWQQSGKPQSDFHGATVLKIDETLPARDPQLGSAHFEGWCSTLRSGWGTPRETTVFFVNGGWYRDHASNDLGEVILYALGAPLSMDFGSMYSPHSPGGFIHSLVLPEAAIGCDGVDGEQVPAQLSDVVLWDDGKTVKQAQLSFMVTLTPNQETTWKLTAGLKPVKPPASDLAVTTGKDYIELTTAATGIRLPVLAMDLAKPPAPIQAVRLPGNQWVGKGWWQTDCKCIGMSAKVIASGPVFARVELHYDFDGGKHYAADIELNAGQDVAVVSEDFNLSEGRRYPMTGADGMKPDVQYAYVMPKFASPDKALVWDWWGQTMAVLPTPNVYGFAFSELKPDSAEFAGRSQYGNLKPGDGGLTFDKDGRFAYINAYMQWGDEETLYLGLYNSKNPAPMIGVIGLRPSRWLHPDIDPHPNAIIKQYTQTNCLTFERRKDGEVFFRAPVCLGKRVYGIGGMTRTLARQVIPDRSGPKVSEKDIWGAALMLRHVRLGRLSLDTVKDWILDYDEPAKYPRLFVPPGDRVRYESRRSRKPLAEVKAELAARNKPPPAEKQAVTDALAKTKALVLHFAQIDKGHMDYGIEEGIYSDLAEDALASPACTPEQARELRHWLAAIAYFALHADFVPPREAGFAWGSANMMAQVQCRACRIVALLPNHPLGKPWREQLAKVVTLYIEDQINEAGVTLECPHYGGMAITMPAMGLAALASAGDVDLTRARQRLRAAAHMRLGTLLPPDVRGGFRSQCPEGDGYYDPEATFATLAGFFQGSDPELSRQLAWGVKEGNNALGGHSDSSFKLFDVGLQPEVPKLGSELYRGHGMVLRNGFPRADEAYLQIYAGSFSWGHGHTDRGSWVMYAKGAPLMLDFAAMYTPSMREQWLHPGGLSFNHDERVRAPGGAEDDWWRRDPGYRELKTAPFAVVEMRANPNSADDLDTFGKVTEFRPQATADYAVMQRRVSYLHRVAYTLQQPHGKDLFNDFQREEVWLQHPFVWTRRFLFVKDQEVLGHNYLVIRDDLSGNQELDANLNLWCLADKLDMDGQMAIYTGQYGVNLHCYVAAPITYKPFTRTVGHPCGFAFSQYYKKTFKKDFREDQILLRVPQERGKGYFVAMVPTKADEPAPTFTTLADGKAIQVVFPDRSDTVVLTDRDETIAVGDLSLTGTAFVINEAKGKRTVTMSAAGSIKRNGKVLLDKPGTIEIK